MRRSKTKLSTYLMQGGQMVMINSLLNFHIVQKKLLIFDMDETLIHCVDDVETDDPDVVLEIDFPDEETVYVSLLI
jgi:hypothetical protein